MLLIRIDYFMITNLTGQSLRYAIDSMRLKTNLRTE
jgi:hypothetical protein